MRLTFDFVQLLGQNVELEDFLHAQPELALVFGDSFLANDLFLVYELGVLGDYFLILVIKYRS